MKVWTSAGPIYWPTVQLPGGCETQAPLDWLLEAQAQRRRADERRREADAQRRQREEDRREEERELRRRRQEEQREYLNSLKLRFADRFTESRRDAKRIVRAAQEQEPWRLEYEMAGLAA